MNKPLQSLLLKSDIECLLYLVAVAGELARSAARANELAGIQQKLKTMLKAFCYDPGCSRIAASNEGLCEGHFRG